MQRRTLLKAFGAGGLATVSGCGAPSSRSAGVSPVWQASVGPVVDVTSFGDAVVAGGPFRPGSVSVIDPVSGRVEWRCERCSDAWVRDGWLFTERFRGGGTTVEAYSGPFTREWTAGGEFESAQRGSVFLWHNADTEDVEYRGELRVHVQASGSRQWHYGFEEALTGVATVHHPDDLYAVVTSEAQFGVQVHRLDAGTGERRWMESVAPGVLPSSVYTGSTLYVGTERSDRSNEASVTAVAPSGRRRWHRSWPGYRAFPEWVGAGTVTVSFTRLSATTPTVRGLDRGDGGLRWSVDATLLAVQGSTGYGYADGIVTAYDLRTGAERRTLEFDPPLSAPPRRLQMIVDAGTMFVAGDVTLVAVDVQSGSERWRYAPAESIRLLGVDAERVYASVGDSLIALPRR